MLKDAMKKISDKENVEMKRSEMIKEHKRLVKILRLGTKEQRIKEADKQEEELSEYL